MIIFLLALLFIAPPTNNDYFEQSSSDGYAFEGMAKAILHQDYSWNLRKADSLEWGIRGEYRESNGHTYSDSSNCMYHLWVNYMFYKQVKKKTNLIVKLVDKIGKYENGLARYVDQPEIDYIVPNATSAMAYIYYHEGRNIDTLLTKLQNFQNIDGNWKYSIRKNGKWVPGSTREDCMHVAMMAYQLKNIKHPLAKSMYEKCLNWIEKNANTPCKGSIGWGIPWTYLMVQDDSLIKKYEKLNTNCLKHKNYRVRAMALWAKVNRDR